MNAKQTKLLRCPNCGEPVSRPSEGCVLHDCIQVIRERGNMPERKLRKLHAGVNPDIFWNHIGVVIDRLEAGDYNRED